MYNYEKKLKELGLEESELSAGTKKKISEFQDLIEALDLDDMEDDEREEAQQDIDENDNAIVDAIEKWYDNRELYAERGRVLAESRKKQPQSNPFKTKPIPVKGETVKEGTEHIKVSEVEEVEAKKEGGGWVFWAALGLVAAITFGQVILKPRE